MMPLDVKSRTYTDFSKENDKEGLKFELCDHVKIFLQKPMFQIGLKKFLLLKRLKIL